MILRFPWSLRLAILLAIAAPLVDLGLVTRWVPDDPISRLEAITAYSVLLWFFIVVHVGLDKFFSYVSTAAAMVVATVVVGAAVRYLFGLGGDTASEQAAVNERLVGVLFMLMISLPYFFFVVQSFSVGKLLERIQEKGSTPSLIGLNIAVAMRVFQHMAEALPPLFSVWSEEHPSKILPRNRNDWRSQGILRRSANLIDWLSNALWAWAKCLFVFSLRVVPSVNSEAIRCYNRSHSEG